MPEVATRERPEQRLVLDGPNEIISDMVARFSEENRLANLRKAELERKEATAKKDANQKRRYAAYVINSLAAGFNINKYQLREVISKVTEKDIERLEDDLARKRMLLAGLWVSIITAFNIVSLWAGLYILDFALLGCLGFIPLCLITLMYSFGPGDDQGQVGNIFEYLGERRQLKKKYGSRYFPHQELREELRLDNKAQSQ